MKRYYYTDPLKAAWMMREFGIKLTAHDPDIPEEERRYDWKRCCEGRPEHNAEANAVWYYDNLCTWDGRIFIHPDCHEMLKPRVGDVVSYNGNLKKMQYFPISKINYDDSYWVEKDNYLIQKYPSGSSCGYNCKSIQIIQRNGKAFFMPESEEV